MRELLPGILCWSRLSEPHGYNFNGTLLLLPEGNLCIDPVEPSPEVLDRLAAEGVARILITNRNHTRAANRVRERTGARIAIHPADAIKSMSIVKLPENGVISGPTTTGSVTIPKV